MTYICVDCGHIFEEGEQEVIREYHSEISGGGYEEFASCPVCGGDFEEAGVCKCCGGHFYANDLIAGYYCKECVEDFMTLDNLKKYAKSDLSAFAEFMYDERCDN